MPVTWKRNTRTLERHHEITGLPPSAFAHASAALALLSATAAVAQIPHDDRDLRAPAAKSPTCCVTVSNWRSSVAGGEALAYYEDAVRQHPQDGNLQQRFDSARVHYDLQRRYADRSFRDSVSRLPFERALWICTARCC